MTKKKHEELVEEVRLIWCRDCGDEPSRYEYSSDLDDDACEGGVVTIKLCRERAKECVTLILSAFRDGRLDEELGVVGRETFSEFAQVGWMVAKYAEGARTFIALRGAGKEGTE